MKIIQKDFTVTETPGGAPSDTGRTVVARISTSAPDRIGDVVVPGGGNFKDFNKNPVLLYRHDDSNTPVGVVSNIRRTATELVASVEFAERPMAHPSSAEWFPDTLLDLYKQGVMKAFSIQLAPKKVRPASALDRKKYGTEAKRIILEWDLVELSCCSIGMHQDALAMAVSKNLIPPDSEIWDDIDDPGPPKAPRQHVPVRSRRMRVTA